MLSASASVRMRKVNSVDKRKKGQIILREVLIKKRR